jgi:hypothetical protein
MILTLKIDGIVITHLALQEFEQRYSEYGENVSFRRTADSTGIIRSTGNDKLLTRIQGKGWMPGGLQGFSRRTAHLLSCPTPRDVISATPTVQIPAARRSDAGYEPYAHAIVDGVAVETAIDSLVGDTVTCAPVSSATGYGVAYYPEITAWLSVNDLTAENGDRAFTWELEAEEI